MTRFSSAWAAIAQENNLLKTIIVIFAGVTIALSVGATRLALRPPLLIERGCFTKVLATTDTQRTENEIEAFIREALSARFETGINPNADFLSIEELRARDEEQAELTRRGIKQRVMLNSISRTGDTITADADRILSVGPLRSAYAFALTVKLESTARSSGNPYGLVLTEIKPVNASPKGDQKP